MAMLALGRTVTIAVLAAVALLATTASTTAATAQQPDTKQLVLRLADLPAGFSLTKSYYADNARAGAESTMTAATYARLGRINGYEADFAREALTGILSVHSQASTYTTAAGATASTHRSFAASDKRQVLDGTPLVWRQVSTGAKLGHEARMYATTVTQQRMTAVVYIAIWRYRTVKAGLTAAGILGTVDAAQVVRLALRQQARIANAVG
jgi:hypothetical protein